MQLERKQSMCPVCGSYLSGGHPQGWGRQVRCVLCHAGSNAELPQRPFLEELRRQFRRLRARRPQPR